MLSTHALEELDAVWRWNAKRYSPAHADNYLQFLKNHIFSLSHTYPKGRRILARPDLSYMLIRRKISGQGHVAVYRIVENVVRVLRVYHTSQNWQTHAAKDE